MTIWREIRFDTKRAATDRKERREKVSLDLNTIGMWMPSILNFVKATISIALR